MQYNIFDCKSEQMSGCKTVHITQIAILSEYLYKFAFFFSMNSPKKGKVLNNPNNLSDIDKTFQFVTYLILSYSK